jgi:hypothetical protein
VRKAAAVAAEQVSHRSCTVGERHDLVVDAGTADVPLDQAGMASSSSIMMILTGLLMNSGSPRPKFMGSVIVNVLPL